MQSLEHVALHALREGCFVLEKHEVDELVKTSGAFDRLVNTNRRLTLQPEAF